MFALSLNAVVIIETLLPFRLRVSDQSDGPLWAALEASWAVLEAVVAFAALGKSLGGNVDASWSLLGAVWGPFWGPLGASWGRLGCLLTALGSFGAEGSKYLCPKTLKEGLRRPPDDFRGL